MLDLFLVVDAASADDSVDLRVLGREALGHVLRHVREGDYKIRLRLQLGQDAPGRLEGVGDLETGDGVFSLVRADRLRFGKPDYADSQCLPGFAALQGYLPNHVGGWRIQGVGGGLDVGRHDPFYEGHLADSRLIAVFVEQVRKVRQVVIVDVCGVMTKVAIALDYPSVFCHNVSG